MAERGGVEVIAWKAGGRCRRTGKKCDYCGIT